MRPPFPLPLSQSVLHTNRSDPGPRTEPDTRARWRWRGGLLVWAVLATACRPGPPPPPPAQNVPPPPRSEDVESLVFLVGDAGAAVSGTSPVLAHLSRAIDRWGADLPDSAVSVLFLGDNQRALGFAEQGQKIAPHLVQVWAVSGNCLLNLGRHEEARACLDRAIVLDEGYWHSHYSLACLFAKTEQSVEALAPSLERAIALHAACREMARTDPDFDAVRDCAAFTEIISGS